ncbi:MAG: hypothetical protein LUD02_15515 [Tannerellaceae bacterium]|nr:hypothetical protein [Tannerellaceae bacterium]MCD8265382.1 hypothetical protein [Tannerellaceae bacterium]
MQSVFDYACLLTTHYASAAARRFHPAAFAKEIGYSKVNSDGREAYRKALVSLGDSIEKLLIQTGVNHITNNSSYANT